MRELGLDLGVVSDWFVPEVRGRLLIARPAGDPADWLVDLAPAVRRCYIADVRLDALATASGISKEEVVEKLLPDPGSVMSGDHGEIISLLFLGACLQPADVLAPKKWRLKNDRTKPISYSDVVQFVVPDWPNASDQDLVVCAEVKSKATPGTSTPIASAIADSGKDRAGRLAKTLAWLDEVGVTSGELDITIRDVIKRFQNAVDHPQAAKEFWAVVVVSSELLEAELAVAPPEADTDPELAIIAIPSLKEVYERLYGEVQDSASSA